VFELRESSHPASQEDKVSCTSIGTAPIEPIATVHLPFSIRHAALRIRSSVYRIFWVNIAVLIAEGAQERKDDADFYFCFVIEWAAWHIVPEVGHVL
jgi:hypothetical protein